MPSKGLPPWRAFLSAKMRAYTFSEQETPLRCVIGLSEFNGITKAQLHWFDWADVQKDVSRECGRTPTYEEVLCFVDKHLGSDIPIVNGKFHYNGSDYKVTGPYDFGSVEVQKIEV